MTKPSRQSNFELLRLVCMFMVLLCHANGYVEEKDLVGIGGVLKLVVNQLCLVCVNVFVMISGWFRIKASWRGVCSLLFQVGFCALLCFAAAAFIGLPVSFRHDLLPYLAFGYGYWFFVSYLILYAISPALNAFVEHSTENEFRLMLILFFAAEFVFGFTLGVGHFDFGFSPLSFIGLYLLAGYVRKYPGRLFSMTKGKDMTIYLCVSVLSMFGLYLGYKFFGMGFHLNHYDSPLAIVASLYFLLFFSKLSFQNKSINYLAASAFAIYLIHENSLVSPWYHQLFSSLKETVPLAAYYPVMFALAAAIGLGCILIDKIRIALWKPLARRFH